MSYHKFFYCISAMVSLGLSTLLLWALVSIHEPEAKLLKIEILPDLVMNFETGVVELGVINIDIEVINKNYFRGFDYTGGGFLELMVTTGSDVSYLWWTNTPVEVQGFKNTSMWPLTVYVLTSEEDWASNCSSLSSQASGIYVSLSLSYWYKILIWTTETNYYQWLDAQVDLNNNLQLLKGPVYFNKTRDFDKALAF